MNQPKHPFDDTSAPMPIFGTRDDALAFAEPIGRNRADAIWRRHPRAPRPILGGGRPGSKEIYGMQQARDFWLDVATNGLSEEVAA